MFPSGHDHDDCHYSRSFFLRPPNYRDWYTHVVAASSEGVFRHAFSVWFVDYVTNEDLSLLSVFDSCLCTMFSSRTTFWSF
jgi:hypothetical protein